MKNGLSDSAVRRLSANLKRGMPSFREAQFRKDCLRGLEELELKSRVQHIVQQLDKHLPGSFLEARKCVLCAAAHWDDGDPNDAFRGFAAWPLIDWVAAAGVRHPAQALETLRQVTHLFTAEFAIRPFLQDHTALALKILHGWLSDPSEHVRRLISEGTRPRLPWGCQLKNFVVDPSPCLLLLEALKGDPSETVRRSVANHLNDISKDNPKTALRICKAWMRGASSSREKLVRHALRTLIKKGEPRALSILGLTTQPLVDVSLTLSGKRLRIGDKLKLQIEIRSTAKRSQQLVVDYAIDYQKANQRRGRKVFKGKTFPLAAGEESQVIKTQAFGDLSTRKHYPGRHTVEILVGGILKAQQSFTLLN